MKVKSIAIDGPSGAGKSTLARMIARELGFLYVDTGAIYRTVGLFVLRHSADPKDAGQVTALLSEIKIEMQYKEDGFQHMLLNGEDVTSAIREHHISGYASDVSAIPAVRAFLLDMQRELAIRNSVVMDGRDIGTQVLPHADLKIFLTAEPEDRARRRYAELLERGQSTEFDTVLRDVIARDQQDAGRAASPLRQAEDAILLDTTGNSLEKSFRELRQVVKENLGI